MKRSLLLGALVSSLVSSLAACDAAAPPPTDSEPAPRSDKGPSRGKPGERPSLAERVVEKTVAWPAASAIDLSTRARFEAAALEKIDASGVPVLAPSRGLETVGAEGRPATHFARATVVARSEWFTIALKDADFERDRLRHRLAGRAPGARGAGLSVFVQGNRTARRIENVPPAIGRQTVRGRPAWITQNEAVWSATWEEHGATYVVELECGDPDDARCKDDATLREVAESLAFVGGRGTVGSEGAK